MFKRILFALPVLLLAACATQSVYPSVEVKSLTISQQNIAQLEFLKRDPKGRPFDMDVSPKDSAIAISTNTGIYLYDFKSSESKHIQFNVDLDEDLKLPGVAFSPDGGFLAIAYDWIYFFDLSRERIVKSIKNVNEEFAIDYMQFSPDGKQLITMGESNKFTPCDSWGGNFQVFDVQREELLYDSYYCRQVSLQYFNITSDGRIYLTGATYSPEYRDFETVILEGSTGSVIEKIKYSFDEDRMGLPTFIRDVSKDGGLFAISVEGGTVVIDRSQQQEPKLFEGDVAFLPDSDNLLESGENPNWALRDPNGNLLCVFEDGNQKLSFHRSIYGTPYKLRGNWIVSLDLELDGYQVWNTTNCELQAIVLASESDSLLVFTP